MKPLSILTGAEARRQLEFQIDRLQNEIALAKERRGGLQAAIDSREKTLARLKAQLVLTSPASQSTPALAG